MSVENHSLFSFITELDTIWLSMCCFGLAFFIILHAFIRKVAVVPTEDRRYRDQLPAGFRLMWPVIRILVHFCGRFIPLKTRKVFHAKLCNAGADYILSAEQFIFSHITSALYLGLFSLCLFNGLDFHSNGLMCLLVVLGFHMPQSWLNKRVRTRETQILKILPTYLDMLTLAMESGSNFTGALASAVDKSKPSPLKQEFSRVLRDIQAGKTKHFALNQLRMRIKLNSINDFVSSILQAEKTGSPVGKILRSQADQRRFERFALAEKLGLEAPVKLLGPLVMFIFPTTFIILLFLIMIKVNSTGILSNPVIDFLMTNPAEMLRLLVSPK